MKWYPRCDEVKLATRIAKSWLEDSNNELKQGVNPELLSDRMEDQTWMFDHIYGWEHDNFGEDGNGVLLTINAINRVKPIVKRETLKYLPDYPEVIQYLRNRVVLEKAES